MTEAPILARATTSTTFRVTADDDPGALVRILGQFSGRNIVPDDVIATLSDGTLRVRIRVSGLVVPQARMILWKIRSSPSVSAAKVTRHRKLT